MRQCIAWTRQVMVWLGLTLNEMKTAVRDDRRERFEFRDSTPAGNHTDQQLRLWLVSFGYVLVEALDRTGLRHTQFANAAFGTIRLKLWKIGAHVRRSVRRIKIAMASACPSQAECHLAYLHLQRAAAF